MGTKKSNGEGHIRKRSDGRWEGIITTGINTEGRQIFKSVYGKTKQEVVRKMAAIQHTLSTGDYIRPESITVSEWLDVWQRDYMGDKKPATQEAYNYQIRVNIVPWIGRYKLQKLTAQNVQRMYTILSDNHKTKYKSKEGKDVEIEADGLSPKSIRNLQGVLHAAFERAIKLSLINHNPCDAVVLPRVEKAEIHPLQGKEIEAFINEISGKPYAEILYTAMFCGMREAELIGLTWDCVDFDNRIIHVSKQLRRERKSNGEKEEYKFAPLKNDRTWDVKPAQSVFDVLRSVKNAQNINRLKFGSAYQNKLNLVFTYENGGHMDAPSLLKALKARAAAIGRPDLRFHDLRHTYATISLQNGADIKTISQSLGHATVAFTMDTYGHVTTEMMEQAADKMQSFINSLPVDKPV